MKHINHTINFDVIKELGFIDGIVLNALKAWSDAEYDEDKEQINGKDYICITENHFIRALSFVLDWDDCWLAIRDLQDTGYIDQPIEIDGGIDQGHFRMTDLGNAMFSRDRSYIDGEDEDDE